MKKNLPMINSKLFQLILGMVLSDATMYRSSHEALVKFDLNKERSKRVSISSIPRIERILLLYD